MAKLSKAMRGLLEAIARGGCYEDRRWSRHDVVTPAVEGEPRVFYARSTFQALQKRGLATYAFAESHLRVPYAITDAGRAELAKGVP